MPAPHIPSFDAIDDVKDTTVQFYAIIGVLVSLSAALELILFDLFVYGTGMPEEKAALIFYRVRSEEAHEGMTDAAVRSALSGHSALLMEWKALFKRMGPASDPARYRNLVAHNPVRKTIFLSQAMFALGAPHHIVTHEVMQDRIQVRAKTRTDLKADYIALKAACLTLTQLHLDLTDFLQRLP